MTTRGLRLDLTRLRALLRDRLGVEDDRVGPTFLKRIGVTSRTWSRWMAGALVSQTNAAALAKALRASVDDIVVRSRRERAMARPPTDVADPVPVHQLAEALTNAKSAPLPGARESDRVTSTNVPEVVVWRGPPERAALQRALVQANAAPTAVVVNERIAAGRAEDLPLGRHAPWLVPLRELDHVLSWLPEVQAAADGSVRDNPVDYPLDAFVDPEIEDAKTRERASALGRVERWLDGGPPLLLVLGDYGLGKTFLSRKAIALAPDRRRLAVRLDLARLSLGRDRRAPDRTVLVETALAQLGLPTEGSVVRSFTQALQGGGIVLVADGFDEAAVKLEAGDVRSLFGALTSGLRTLITCRPNYFESQQHLVHDLGTELPSLVGALPTQTDLVTIREYDEPRVRALIASLAPSLDVARGEALFARRQDLGDLARRPVLLRLVLEHFEALEGLGDTTLTTAGLYDTLARVWLERDRGKHTLAPETKLAFMEELAFTLRLSGDDSIAVGDLRQALARHLGSSVRLEDLRTAFTDVRTASFLIRVDDRFRFAHRSFEEFFFARRLTALIVRGDVSGFATKAQLTPAIAAFTLDCLTEGIGEVAGAATARRRAARTAIEGVLRGRRLEGKANALELALAWRRRQLPDAPKVGSK